MPFDIAAVIHQLNNTILLLILFRSVPYFGPLVWLYIENKRKRGNGMQSCAEFIYPHAALLPNTRRPKPKRTARRQKPKANSEPPPSG